MIHMSLRVFEKQSLHSQGDCFATCARNDMLTASLPAPCSSGRLQSQTGEEFDALLLSGLDRASKGGL